jgi:hypothetical protein
MPKAVPTRSETGSESARARSECAPTGLPTEPTVTGVPGPGAEAISQPPVKAVRDGDTVAQSNVCAVHDGGDDVTHQRGAVFGDRGDRALVIPAIALVVTPIALVVAAIALVVAAVALVVAAVTRVVAPITRVVAILVGQDLLQTTDRVASEVRSGHRISRRHCELVRRHVDQAGVAHGLIGAIEEGLSRFRVGKQVQDVSDQRVHDRFPSNL